jgi:hypothetical protein
VAGGVTTPTPEQVDLIELSRLTVLDIVRRGLDGQLLPGLLWSAEQVEEQPDGSVTVHFAVFGDLVSAIPLLDLPEAIQDLVLEEVEILVRGRITLTLEPSVFSGLRRTFGLAVPDEAPADSHADPSLLDAYAQGLDLTARHVDDLERRARRLVEEGRTTILDDIGGVGGDADVLAPKLDAILAPPITGLIERMDDRRARIVDLLADLHDLVGAPVAEAAATLEAVLGEEYALASEAEADYAAFARIVRLALEESGEMLGR